jgi:hypothetical protein
MASQSTSAAVLAPPADPPRSPAPVQSFFVHTAALEFQAALQLLLERARFLTGANAAGVALKEQGRFIYSAATGDLAAETGDPVGEKKYLSECMRLGKVVRTRTDSIFALAVPILRGAEVAGVFELLGDSAFEDRDAASVARLAEMAGTAMDHKNAAALAETLAFDEILDVPTAPATSCWHAPDLKEPGAQSNLPSGALPIEVHKCASCGFPVSNGRKLCVDCDKNSDLAQEPAALFTTPAEENWLSAHGYTIASVLVSIITIAFILWLRAR